MCVYTCIYEMMDICTPHMCMYTHTWAHTFTSNVHSEVRLDQSPGARDRAGGEEEKPRKEPGREGSVARAEPGSVWSRGRLTVRGEGM